MLTTTFYNMKGEKIGEVELPSGIFDVPMNPDLVHRVAVSQAGNVRQVLAHAKGRGEVSGGGKKPWKQKGTGRSRHGSIRSPIWRHGGAVGGPTKERNFSRKINKKTAKKAVLMMLSSKLADNELIIFDRFDLPEPRTKVMADLMKRLPQSPKSALIVLTGKEGLTARAARNLPKTKTIICQNMNVRDLLSHKYLLMPKEALEELKQF